MSPQEWGELEAFIASNWQNAKTQSPEQVQLRYLVVEDLERDEALAALVTMVREGREFPPNPGQLYAAVAEAHRPALPSPGEVLQLVVAAAGRFGRNDELGALRWLSERTPYAARFAIEHGWRELCMEQIDSPKHGGAVRARLEQSIASTIRGLESEYRRGEVRTLVGDRVRRLELGHGDARRGLQQLDVGSLLPQRPQLEPGSDEDAGAVAA